MVKLLSCASVDVLRRSPNITATQHEALDAQMFPSVSGFIRMSLGNDAHRRGISRHEFEEHLVASLFQGLGELCGTTTTLPPQQATTSASTSGIANGAAKTLMFNKGVQWTSDQSQQLRQLVTLSNEADQLIAASRVSIAEKHARFEDDDSGQQVSRLQDEKNDCLTVTFLCSHAQFASPTSDANDNADVFVPVLMQGAISLATSETTTAASHSTSFPLQQQRSIVRHYPLPQDRTLSSWCAAPPLALVTSLEGCLRDICFKVGILPKYGA
ncbi:Hypothetical protein, putative [Bodo saltans]|uniref:Uncharacterized protein n=1 Tax=Bodo saltans TaxID=75058 RepID=A0A0S4JPY2_BODSA|nr:Hypothetical protein, putative [Bodo saltans]|eukprot:CUG93597.1 Hypothetical protein, putative [Bodo saltans]